MSIDHHSIPEWEWNKLSFVFGNNYFLSLCLVVLCCCLSCLTWEGQVGYAGSMVDGRG